jgi:hypothetical protein
LSNQQGDATEYFQGMTRAEFELMRRLFAVLGREKLADIVDELEAAARCRRVTDVTIGYDQTGRAVMVATYRKRSLVR